MAGNTSPEYGKRLIPQILDRLAAAEPDCIVYSIATFSRTPTFRDISARTFANAVDKTAWWLHEHIQSANGVGKGEQNTAVNGDGKELPKIQPLGYIGPRK